MHCSEAEGTEFLLSLFLAGVLLDIQQHFGVKDSGAGLLQTGKSVFLLIFVTSCFSGRCFQISSGLPLDTLAVKDTRTGKMNEAEGGLVLIC